MAIRVEMLLLGPVLLVAFITGLATAVFGYKRAV
jgi:flagellar biosynthesis protein FliQ